MAHYHNQGSVSNQAHTQNIYGNVQFIAKPSDTPAPVNYDLGVRLGQAPLIDDDLFVGREKELENLQSWLAPTPGKQNIVALWGMGGVGKTQLSMHFIRNPGYNRYSAVFWLDAKDQRSLQAGLAKLAVEVKSASITLQSSQSDINEVGEEQLEILALQARRWLSEQGNDKWLLVLDNYDDPHLPDLPSTTGYDIRAFFPMRAHGSILITTRSSRLTFARQLPLAKLHDEQQGLSILARRSGRDVFGDEYAIQLVRYLEGLPLGLATAGAYLRYSPISFREYLSFYSHEWHNQNNYNGQSDYDGQLDEYNERTLYSTWNLSFQQVQAQDPEAAQLLKLMAYLNNKDLWYELFINGRDHQQAPNWWKTLLQSRARFDRALGILSSYSLLEVNKGSYSLHTCIHDWALEYLNQGSELEMYRIAIHCIAGSIFDEADYKNWDKEYWLTDQRLLPHARRFQHEKIAAAIQWSEIEPSDCLNLAFLYSRNDLNKHAEIMYQVALRGFEDRSGIDHESTLQAVHGLGRFYLKERNVVKAEPILLRALKGRETLFGPKDMRTLDTVNELGRLYVRLDNLGKAEEMLRRVLKEQERTLGPEHLKTLHTVGLYGGVYRRRGRFAKAEQMYQRTLQGQDRILGTGHIKSMNIIANLGLIHIDRKNFAAAEARFSEARLGLERLLGPDHSRTLDMLAHLGNIYNDMGRLSESKTLLEQAFERQEKILGRENMSTIRTMGWLGHLYTKLGQTVDARNMLQEALQGYEKAQRKTNPEYKAVSRRFKELDDSPGLWRRFNDLVLQP